MKDNYDIEKLNSRRFKKPGEQHRPTDEEFLEKEFDFDKAIPNFYVKKDEKPL